MTEVRQKADKGMDHRLKVRDRRVHPVLMTIALGLVLTLSTGGVQMVGAQEGVQPDLETITRCEPEWARVPMNQEVTVCIYVQDVVGLYGADFEMSFPGMVGIATVADEDSGTPGVQILRNWTWVPSGWVVFANEANNSTGYLHYLTYGWNPAPAIDGSGPIACMRFQPGAAGEFYMTFTRHDLSDRSGNLITNNANTCRVTFYDPNAVSFQGMAARSEISSGWWVISCLAAAVALYGGWRRRQPR